VSKRETVLIENIDVSIWCKKRGNMYQYAYHLFLAIMITSVIVK